MTKPRPYSPGRHGPTLLYIFQSYLPGEGSADNAAARLEDEIRAEIIKTTPPLDPKDPHWHLRPKKGHRRHHLVYEKIPGKVGTMKVTERRVNRSETEYSEGSARLDVVDAKGRRTGAENFYGRESRPLTYPPSSVPPGPAVEPVAPIAPVKTVRGNERAARRSEVANWLREPKQRKGKLRGNPQTYFVAYKKRFPELSYSLNLLDEALREARGLPAVKKTSRKKRRTTPRSKQT